MKKQIIIIVSAFLLMTLLFVNALACSVYEKEISGNVIRLHVIANSDSENDQRIKLLVRDRVLSYMKRFDEEAYSKEEYAALIYENLSKIEAQANDELISLGRSERARASLETCEFPKKIYGKITLPKGEYSALRIVIGDGAGQNWWCVMYPPLCTGAFDDISADEYFEKKLSHGAYLIVTDEKSEDVYEIRLKAADLVRERLKMRK